MAKATFTISGDNTELIKALHGAGASFTQLEQQASRFGSRLGGAATGGAQLDDSMRRAGAGIRTIMMPAALQLGDALGSTVSRMAGVVASGAALGGTMGLAAAGVGV